jgi:putative methyltransferase (TIGR04325 family)
LKPIFYSRTDYVFDKIWHRKGIKASGIKSLIPSYENPITVEGEEASIASLLGGRVEASVRVLVQKRSLVNIQSNGGIMITIRDFVPPILLLLRRKLAKQYNSYHEAWNECASCDFDLDYRISYERTKSLCAELNTDNRIKINFDHMFALCALLMALKQETTTNIVDFGGACGHYYFIVRRLLDDKYSLNWTVVEREGIVNYAKALSNNELAFSDNLEEVIHTHDDIDLLIASGVIQYLPNPYHYLKLIANSSSKFILLNRMAMTLGGRDIILLQKYMLSQKTLVRRLPDDVMDKEFRVPYTGIQKAKTEDIMSTFYEKVFEVDNRSGVLPICDKNVVGIGTLYKKVDQ